MRQVFNKNFCKGIMSSKISQIKILFNILILLMISFSTLSCDDEISIVVKVPVLNMRECPSTKCKILQKLKENEKIQVEENQGEWSKIKKNDLEGYVISRSIGEKESTTNWWWWILGIIVLIGAAGSTNKKGKKTEKEQSQKTNKKEKIMAQKVESPKDWSFGGKKEQSQKTNKKEKIMAQKVELPRDWSFDGKKLKPKNGSNNDTWIWNGKRLMPYSGSSRDAWEYNETTGKIWPYLSASLSKTWILTDTQLKPVYGANSTNTYDRNGQPVAVCIARVIGLF